MTLFNLSIMKILQNHLSPMSLKLDHLKDSVGLNNNAHNGGYSVNFSVGSDLDFLFDKLLAVFYDWVDHERLSPTTLNRKTL